METARPGHPFVWVAIAALAVGGSLEAACGSNGSRVGSADGQAGGGVQPGSGGQLDSGGQPGTGPSSAGGGWSTGGASSSSGGGSGAVAGDGGNGAGGSGSGSGGSANVDSGSSSADTGGTSDGAAVGIHAGPDASDAGPTTSAYNPCPSSGTDCTIMPFGDSITDGFTVLGGYRIPFFQGAHQEGKQFTFVGSAINGPATVAGVPFPQHHEGHSGFTINDEPSVARKGIAPLVSTVIPQFHPDIVLLMIGTNDVDNSVDLPNVPNRLGALIDSIIALDSHTLIVVAQITPSTQDPLNMRIQAYNAGIPTVVKARADAGKHVALVDMYSAFVQDPAFKTTHLADRLHPNAAGYQTMSDVWNTVVHDLLR